MTKPIHKAHKVTVANINEVMFQNHTKYNERWEKQYGYGVMACVVEFRGKHTADIMVDGEIVTTRWSAGAGGYKQIGANNWEHSKIWHFSGWEKFSDVITRDDVELV